MIAPDAPTLAEKTDHGPGVEVFFPALDAAAASITVWRVADGQREEVQGAKRATAPGDFVITDWGVPFGVPSTYVGEIFDTAGASIIGASSVIQVDRDEVWISNPIDPEQAFPVDLELKSFSTITRSRRTQQVFVMGLSRPFEQNWGLGGIESLPFRVTTYTTEEGAALKSLLESSPLLIRTPPKFNTLPRLLSASIKQPVHDPFDWDLDGEAIVWTLTVDEVQPVSKAIIRPLITWDDWTAAFPPPATWDDVMAVYAAGTWTDAIRNPPNA